MKRRLVMNCLDRGTDPDLWEGKKLERQEDDWLPIIVKGRPANQFAPLVGRIFRVAGVNALLMQNQKLSDDRKDLMEDIFVLNV